MNGATWIAIYTPIFIFIFVILPHQRAVQNAGILNIKKRKGVIIMTNELLKKYIGNNCHISTGTFGINIVGKIIEVNEKWIEVETKKGSELINSEYIQSIKIKAN